MSSLPEEYPYQRYMRQKIESRKRTAVIGVPGCGKTRPIIDALGNLGVIEPLCEYYTPEGSILIVCSGAAIPTWRRQLPEWVNESDILEYIHIVRGDKMARSKVWNRAQDGEGIYITNFSVFWRDFNWIQQIPWAAAVCDEYHKTMRRRSATFKKFQSLTRHMEIVILASGSFISKTPETTFTAFGIIDPKVFRSYWKFVNTYCIVNEGPFGKEILGPKNVESFKRLMDQYLAYVPKEVVADQMPEGSRQPVDVEMTPKQAKAYREITDDMLAVIEDSGEIIIAATKLTQLIRLRQLLCCPMILDETLGMGGGYQAIVERLEEQSHIVIFVPFRPACDYIAADLKKKGYDVGILRGGITSDEQEGITQHFRKNKSIIVCTIQYAESFDLETCETSYFLGYSYLVDENEQAEGRTSRNISQHDFITWNYIKYANTIDEDILINLSLDMINIKRVMNRPEELIEFLKGHRK